MTVQVVSVVLTANLQAVNSFGGFVFRVWSQRQKGANQRLQYAQYSPLLLLQTRGTNTLVAVSKG